MDISANLQINSSKIVKQLQTYCKLNIFKQNAIKDQTLHQFQQSNQHVLYQQSTIQKNLSTKVSQQNCSNLQNYCINKIALISAGKNQYQKCKPIAKQIYTQSLLQSKSQQDNRNLQDTLLRSEIEQEYGNYHIDSSDDSNDEEDNQKENKTMQNDKKEQIQQTAVKKDIKKYKFFDIAANLSSGRFKGFYGETKVHKGDLKTVVERANAVGCQHLIIPGATYKDSLKALEIAKQNPFHFITVGVHPCFAYQIKSKNKETFNNQFEELSNLIQEDKNKAMHERKVIAVGECGLDYARLECSSKNEQRPVFIKHFELAARHDLPMYFHCRDTGFDFVDLVAQNRKLFKKGVVHSFTNSKEELFKILDMGLYVGVNGCSFKTDYNMQVAKLIPLDRLLIETDAPYCDIKKSHAGYQYVKTFNYKYQNRAGYKKLVDTLVHGRNEPCEIIQVAEVVSALLNKEVEEIADATHQNAMDLFEIQKYSPPV